MDYTAPGYLFGYHPRAGRDLTMRFPTYYPSDGGFVAIENKPWDSTLMSVEHVRLFAYNCQIESFYWLLEKPAISGVIIPDRQVFLLAMGTKGSSPAVGVFNPDVRKDASFGGVLKALGFGNPDLAFDVSMQIDRTGRSTPLLPCIHCGCRLSAMPEAGALLLTRQRCCDCHICHRAFFDSGGRWPHLGGSS